MLAYTASLKRRLRRRRNGYFGATLAGDSAVTVGKCVVWRGRSRNSPLRTLALGEPVLSS